MKRALSIRAAKGDALPRLRASYALDRDGERRQRAPRSGASFAVSVIAAAPCSPGAATAGVSDVFESDQVQAAVSDEIRRGSGRFVVIGIAAIVLGFLSLAYTGLMTLSTLFIIGGFLLVGGIAHLIQAVRSRDATGVFFQLPIGLFEVTAGTLVLSRPAASLLTMTIVLATFFIGAGIFRTVASVLVKPPSWGWTFASGLASLLLGVSVWAGWPQSSVWLLGTYVSAYLIVAGMSYIALGMAGRRLAGGAPIPGTA
jgi:uncharacterized membrane protein HdeD (DUF308 family)